MGSLLSSEEEKRPEDDSSHPNWALNIFVKRALGEASLVHALGEVMSHTIYSLRNPPRNDTQKKHWDKCRSRELAL